MEFSRKLINGERKGERGTVDVFGKRAPHIPERASRNVLFTVGRPWKARQPCPAFYSKSVNLLLSNFHIATPHPSTYAHGFACTEECGAGLSTGAAQIISSANIILPVCISTPSVTEEVLLLSDEGLADFHVQCNNS